MYVFVCTVGPAKWLQQQLRTLSPSPSHLQTHCNISSFSSSSSIAIPSHLGSRGIGTLAVLGELQLRPGGGGGGGGEEDQLLSGKAVMNWLGNVTSLVRDVDIVLTNFLTLVRKSETESAQQVLR